MQNRVLRTPVDSLVELLKKHKSLKVEQIGSMLKLPNSIIEKWLVILEEYGILKITYSGLEGYVQYKEKKDTNETQIENIKNEFIEKCKERKLTLAQIRPIWFEFLHKTKPKIKEEFIEANKKKGYQYAKIKQAWIKFERELEEF